MTNKQLTNVVDLIRRPKGIPKWLMLGSIFDSANGTTVAPGAIAQSLKLWTLPVGGTGYLQFPS